MACAEPSNSTELALAEKTTTASAHPSPSGRDLAAEARVAEMIARVAERTASAAMALTRAEVASAAARNARIPEEVRSKLPAAAARIAEVTPNPRGVSSPSWGKGATSWVQTLERGYHGAAFAYEMLAAAQVVDTPHNAGNSSRSLEISPARGDQVTFGARLDARDTSALSRTIEAKDRQTVEADLLVHRGDNHGRTGVDFKYSSTADRFNFGSKTETREVLAGVARNIAAGNVAEWHFVTNGTFPAAFKAEVERVNDELTATLQAQAESVAAAKEAGTVDQLPVDVLAGAALYAKDGSPAICWHEGVTT
jgi:hypothetical protein